MDWNYAVQKRELEKADKCYAKAKLYGKKLLPLAKVLAKMGIISGLYFGISEIRTHMQEIKDMCNLYENKLKQDQDRQLLLIFFALTTTTAVASLGYLVCDTAKRQWKIWQFYNNAKVNFEVLLKAVTNRAHMMNVLEQFYTNKISKEQIIEVYRALSQDNQVITEEFLNEIIRNNPLETLSIKVTELTNEFLKRYHKKLEFDLLNEHTWKILGPAKVDGKGIGIIITVVGMIRSNLWITGGGLVLEQSRLSEVAMTIFRDCNVRISTENEQTFKIILEKVLSDLRKEYEKIFGFTLKDFDEVARDEYLGYIKIREKYRLDGTKEEYACQNLSEKDHYYERSRTVREFCSDSAQTCKNLMLSCIGAISEVLTCTRDSGYEALSSGYDVLKRSSTQIADGTGTIRDGISNFFVSKNLHELSVEDLEMQDIEIN